MTKTQDTQAGNGSNIDLVPSSALNTETPNSDGYTVADDHLSELASGSVRSGISLDFILPLVAYKSDDYVRDFINHLNRFADKIQPPTVASPAPEQQSLASLLAKFAKIEVANKAAEIEFNQLIEKSKTLAPYPPHALLDQEDVRPNLFDPSKGVQLIKPSENEQEAFSWKQAYEAWERGQGVQLTPDGPFLRKAKGDACPQVILDVKQWTDERNAVLAKLDYEGLCGRTDAINDKRAAYIDEIYLAPALSLGDAIKKLSFFIEHERRCLESVHETAIDTINNEIQAFFGQAIEGAKQ